MNWRVHGFLKSCLQIPIVIAIRDRCLFSVPRILENSLHPSAPFETYAFVTHIRRTPKTSVNAPRAFVDLPFLRCGADFFTMVINEFDAPLPLCMVKDT
jgi:hypothetical protein